MLIGHGAVAEVGAYALPPSICQWAFRAGWAGLSHLGGRGRSRGRGCRLALHRFAADLLDATQCHCDRRAAAAAQNTRLLRTDAAMVVRKLLSKFPVPEVHRVAV